MCQCHDGIVCDQCASRMLASLMKADQQEQEAHHLFAHEEVAKMVMSVGSWLASLQPERSQQGEGWTDGE